MAEPATNCRVLRFSAFEVDPELRELRKRGIRLKLTGQPFQALLLLLERSPAVVTREELRQALWPDQPWGDHDHRLNKAVNRIREALSDSAETPRFLETLPRVGYRFLAPVERVAEPESSSPGVASGPPPMEIRSTVSAGPEAPGKRRLFLRLAIAACVLIVLTAGALLAYRAVGSKAERLPATAEARPLTTYLGSELQPSFSPDGKQVAFIWNGEAQADFHVYIMAVTGGAVRQLTHGGSSEFGPAWSPDGRRIAFLSRQADDKAEIRMVDVDGTNETPVATLGSVNAGHPLSWTRNSQWLVVSTQSPGDGPPALFLVSATSGERRRLTAPPVLSGGDYSPAISPDGRRVAFIRWTNSSWQDIFVMNLSNDLAPAQDPVRLTDLHRLIDTLAWTGDGRELVFSSANSLAGARFLFRVPVAHRPPKSEVTDTGIEGVDPAVSPDGSTLVYARRNIEQTSIWRLHPAAGAKRTETLQPARLISSTRRDFTADMAPDGKRLIFSSARTGRTDIWLCDVDGGNLKQVTSFGASTPRWSPNGRKVVFESTRDGQSEIYTIDIETNAVRRLTFDISADVRPSWSRDGRFVYFSSKRTGKFQIWKVPSEGGEAVQITQGGGAYAVEGMDGRNLYYLTPDQPSAVRFTTIDGGEEHKLIDSVVGYSSIAVGRDGLYFLASITPAGARLEVYDFSAQSRRTVLAIDRPVHHFLSSPPDGSSILYTRIDREDSDLMLRPLRQD